MDQKDIDLLSNPEIPESVRSKIAEQIFATEDRAADRELESRRIQSDRTKVLWNTPLVAAVAGLLTLSATFVFDRFTARDTTTNTITLEQELALLAAKSEERKFQYEIVQSELTNAEKSNAERAEVLLFLVRAGILSTLNEDELRKMAEEQIENPEAAIIPNLTAMTPYSELLENPGLARQVQERLSELGYLDPPADGVFGPVSRWALRRFVRRNGLPDDGVFGPLTAHALEESANPLPDMPQTGGWLDRVVAHMQAEDYWICRVPGCRNIVYLEGANPDGTLNDNAPNRFNDVRLVFWLDEEGALEMKSWEATTEPGRRWTERPINPRGAARLAFGQYGAWRVGMHRASTSGGHEALVQVNPVAIYRDLNKDFARTGDREYTGLFGVNQHGGHDLPRDDAGAVAAGSLIGRTMVGHLEFMELLKTDPRYRASSSHIFTTTILPADRVLK